MREPRHTTSTASSGPARVSGRGPLGMVGSALRGLLEGALPMLILIAIVALFVEVATIVSDLSNRYGFNTTQPISTWVGVGGVVVCLIVFVVAGLRTLAGVRDRHADGDYVESTVAMIVLLISVLYILFAFLGVTGIPQHPAP